MEHDKCPHCGYKTLVNGFCMSCGYGITDEPILQKDSSDKRWKTEPPTEEGWYWVKWKERHKRNQVVYLQKDDKFEQVLVVGDIHSRNVSDFSHWLGPLPMPEPPNG